MTARRTPARAGQVWEILRSGCYYQAEVVRTDGHFVEMRGIRRSRIRLDATGALPSPWRLVHDVEDPSEHSETAQAEGGR